MTESQMDVFGPGFVPGKVSAVRDVASRAMSRTYNTGLDASENTDDRAGGAFDVPDHSPASKES